MDEAIKSLCKAIQGETRAIQGYTDHITVAIQYEMTEKTADVYEKLRLDHVEHLQSLCIELTRLVSAVTLTPESEDKNE